MNIPLNNMHKKIRLYTESEFDVMDVGRYVEDLSIEARSSWASMLFTNSNDAALRRYTSYQLRELDKQLTLLTENILSRPTPCSGGAISTPQDIFSSFFALLDAFFEDFSEYFDDSITCPDVYKVRVCLDIINQHGALLEWIQSINIDPIISQAIASYLNLISGPDKSQLSYRDVAYYKKFITGLSFFMAGPTKEDLTGSLIEKLIELNFNHLDLFGFHQDKLKSHFAELEGHEGISVIRQLLLHIPYQQQKQTLRLDLRWPSLSTMLTNWLTSELQALEISVAQTASTPESNQKLSFRLPVAHLACLIRLFAKEHIFGEMALTEIFEFFATNCSSKRQRVISAGGISKEFYSKSQVVAAEMRDILTRMINRINRDYFPVVAAILLIIGVC
ncbi:hypothetical protein [Mucilaginibacter sp. SJ]|uniref:hypothetical protein n=1 Tax=Mucilaginibacter sp. SJ TaxID=3029053 RepID=UPI0023AA01AF|nr:hypothetical protein [Mucilaginibacter sp. SJ]WEA00722.1 hypothetical protein MusilaSJ_25030 [Mucilaginibacter sp. SJ]